jgi:type I restriction enzyme S subunit
MNNTYAIQNKNFDKKRVFILPYSELEKRLDPSWYVYLKSVNSFRYNKIALKKLLLENPQYGANEIGIIRNNISEPRYIRITDINEFGELDKDFGKTASLIEDKYILEENDLLLARSGNTVGKSYLHKDVGYECFFAGYMIRFKIDAEKVLPQYVFAYTQTTFYKNWVKAIQRATGQPNINAEEYRNLEIPLPNIEIQNKVVEFLNQALEKKKQYEIQSEKLLASIDDYLLGELGITLPAENDYSELSVQQQGFELNKQNSLVKKGRLFLTSFSNLQKRIDPYYYQKYFISSFNTIVNSTYPTTNLKNISSKITSGITPLSGGDAYTSITDGIPFIRSGNIDIDGELNFNDLLYLKPEIHQTLLKSSQLQYGDLMIAIVGATIGQVGIYMNIREANINQAIALVRLKKEINHQYIKELIKSSIGQLSLNRLKRPVARANINLEEISTILVVLPPLDKQKEIANRIQIIRSNANDLKTKAIQTLQQAKEEIEKIILFS